MGERLDSNYSVNKRKFIAKDRYWGGILIRGKRGLVKPNWILAEDNPGRFVSILRILRCRMGRGVVLVNLLHNIPY